MQGTQHEHAFLWVTQIWKVQLLVSWFRRYVAWFCWWFKCFLPVLHESWPYLLFISKTVLVVCINFCAGAHVTLAWNILIFCFTGFCVEAPTWWMQITCEKESMHASCSQTCTLGMHAKYIRWAVHILLSWALLCMVHNRCSWHTRLPNRYWSLNGLCISHSHNNRPTAVRLDPTVRTKLTRTQVIFPSWRAWWSIDATCIDACHDGMYLQFTCFVCMETDQLSYFVTDDCFAI